MLRLTVERVRSGLSKARVARKAEIDQGSISKFESGRRYPYPGELRRLARAVGWKGDPAALLEHVADPPPAAP